MFWVTVMSAIKVTHPRYKPMTKTGVLEFSEGTNVKRVRKTFTGMS